MTTARKMGMLKVHALELALARSAWKSMVVVRLMAPGMQLDRPAAHASVRRRPLNLQYLVQRQMVRKLFEWRPKTPTAHRPTS